LNVAYSAKILSRFVRFRRSLSARFPRAAVLRASRAALLLQIPYIFLFLESKSLKKADSLKKQPKSGFKGKQKARKH